MLEIISQSLYIWAILQGLMIALAILLNHRLYASKLYVIFFLLAAVETFFQYMYSHSASAYKLTLYMFTYECANLLYGPIVFLALLKNLKKPLIGLKSWLHFIPALIFLIHYFVDFVIPYYPLKFNDWVGTDANIAWLIACAISLLAYFAYAMYLLKNQTYAKFNVLIKPLLIFLMIKGINAIIAALYIPVYTMKFEWYYETLFLKDLVFIGSNSYMIYVTIFLIFKRESIIGDDRSSTHHPAFIEDHKDTISNLEKLMKESQVFVQPDLSKEKLAKMLEVQPYILSRIINEGYGKSFWDYINESRVELAKEMLLKNDEKMLAIAIKCGYNSESVFYKNFRKIAGQTPKKIQAQMRKSEMD
ncbi:helix-turn-helix transcriptional regulator [Reichenbachiella carrageenanivorans]|uniref:Helix-turn-helix transcriptional regulator n=1 Tax=Reichenbachiella carrageenanivorans TaxID=2979869 RepID=A0ABY6DB00_9BACT|nr:helix-turn-helix transcriptional regulator [Reichenbachiella carrageenanivorans]UXX81020.1 helix-turn-helix transcriptional regulator [Reichenbachiella carrageenanivorans]